MIVKCDGCDVAKEAGDIGFFQAKGHVLRYCTDCQPVYQQFVGTVQSEAARVQRLLDLWEEDARKHVPLRLTPTDLPDLVTDSKGTALVLR